jgi:AcrR family transcriptional regulator
MPSLALAEPPNPVPLAGKREQTKVQNRQAILDAAREVFGEVGYEAASVRDIIRRTSLSVGAFYNYFRSKDELCEALAGDGAAKFQPVLRAQREQAPISKATSGAPSAATSPSWPTSTTTGQARRAAPTSR